MRAAVVLRNAAKAGQSAAAAGKQAPMSADQSLYHLEPEVSCSAVDSKPAGVRPEPDPSVLETISFLAPRT